jgi:uncharacterized protein (DUF1778 family)
MSKKKKAPATKVITVRVTENEFNLITEFAAKAQMTKSEFVRDCTCKEQSEKRKRTSRVVFGDHEKASLILSKLGALRYANNLNQIAKAINQGVVTLSAETETALFDACIFIVEIRTLLTQAIHKRAKNQK